MTKVEEAISVRNEQEIRLTCRLQNLTEEVASKPEWWSGSQSGEFVFTWFTAELGWPGPLTLTGLRFSSSKSRSDWTKVPKSFAVWGSKNMNCKKDKTDKLICTCFNPHVHLFRVSRTDFTGPNQSRYWPIPCHKRDAYHCYTVHVESNHGHSSRIATLGNIIFYHSKHVDDLIP